MCDRCVLWAVQHHNYEKSAGSKGLFPAELINTIVDDNLFTIEQFVIDQIDKAKLSLLTREVASRALPSEVAMELKEENLNFGSQYSHGIF